MYSCCLRVRWRQTKTPGATPTPQPHRPSLLKSTTYREEQNNSNIINRASNSIRLNNLTIISQSLQGLRDTLRIRCTIAMLLQVNGLFAAWIIRHYPHYLHSWQEKRPKSFVFNNLCVFYRVFVVFCEIFREIYFKIMPSVLDGSLTTLPAYNAITV